MKEMPIEWGKLREYAVATGSQNPDYLDNFKRPDTSHVSLDGHLLGTARWRPAHPRGSCGTC